MLNKNTNKKYKIFKINRSSNQNFEKNIDAFFSTFLKFSKIFINFRNEKF